MNLLFGTFLTGNILESHLGIILLYQACTALAHIEDTHGATTGITVGRTTTAHTTHDEYPEEYQQEHGTYVDKEAPPWRINLVLITHITAEITIGTLCFYKLVQFVGTGILCHHGRFLPLEILGTGEDIAIVLG